LENLLAESNGGLNSESPGQWDSPPEALLLWDAGIAQCEQGAGGNRRSRRLLQSSLTAPLPELERSHVMAHFADHGVIVIAAIISAGLVLRMGFIGFVIGVFSIWALGILRIELLYRLDPQRDTAVMDAAWVAVFGWIVGVIWCVPLLAGRLLFRRTRRSQRHENGF